ncbi:hypothetical protein [Kitasatospora sp. NPDC085879]|uniref:hypothetical protein n=1 Tax=Kitasatospora sp. NPDC085879 TaxID=3154769 RepID=UPI00341C8627
MTITQPDTAVRAPSRWAVRVAHLVPFLVLPSGLWRLLLATGHPAGYTEAGYRALGVTGWGAGYVVGLSAAGEVLALLTIGLVRPWGEALPRWLPLLGGRLVPVRAATAAAAAGALALTVLWTPFAFWWALPHPDLTATGRTVAGLLYLPLVTWGPLLAAVTVSSYRHRRPTVRTDRQSAPPPVSD